LYPVTLPHYLHFAGTAVTTACWQECSVNCETSLGVSHWVPGSKQQRVDVQGGSNMTGTDCVQFTHK